VARKKKGKGKQPSNPVSLMERKKENWKGGNGDNLNCRGKKIKLMVSPGGCAYIFESKHKGVGSEWKST